MVLSAYLRLLIFLPEIWIPAFVSSSPAFLMMCTQIIWCVCIVSQLCLTLCGPIDYSPPGSSVHGIFQARILEGVVILCSEGSSQPRDQTLISCVSSISRQVLYHWCHLGSLNSGSDTIQNHRWGRDGAEGDGKVSETMSCHLSQCFLQTCSS